MRFSETRQSEQHDFYKSERAGGTSGGGAGSLRLFPLD